MSLQIIKAGILDTVQDQGRFGYQHLGVNPSGAMDSYSSQLANALLGKDLNDAVIEMYFPGAQIQFNQQNIICICGADFSPTINKKIIPLHQPMMVNKNSVLHFVKKITGSVCYLAILNSLKIQPWLGSCSTNLSANAGGFEGRALKKNDNIEFENNINKKMLFANSDFKILRWKANANISTKKEIRFTIGTEWGLLTGESKNNMVKNKFTIEKNSNRMGYRLAGEMLRMNKEIEMISSGVTFGTMQLLPSGQLIILMADHQTTGGYPRIGNVISADLPLLAQCNPGNEINFIQTDLKTAEEAHIKQQMNLLQIQTAAKFKMEALT